MMCTPAYRIGVALALIALLLAVPRLTSQSVLDGPFRPRPARVSSSIVDGTAALLPDKIQAAAIGSYELTVRVGNQGLQAGGGVLVAFPKAWFVNPFPIPKRLQTTDSTKAHFLSVTSSRAGAMFDIAVDTVGFTGKIERFNQTIALTVAGAPLQPGDVVSVRLANTTAPYVAGADDVKVAMDVRGDKQFMSIASARYEIASGAAEDFTLVGPTEATVGQAVTLQLTAFDHFSNVAESFSGTVEIDGMGAHQRVQFSPEDHGSTTITWTPRKEGFYFPEASIRMVGRRTAWSSRGNPIRVFTKEPETRTYWGELHSHSAISADGIGNDPFPYARGAARLDFFASTEHADDDGNVQAGRGGTTSAAWGNAIRPEEWEAIKARVEQFNEPGRFVTMLAYECSLRAPSGHHNVFFRSTEGVPWPSGLIGNIATLWSKIAAGDAITIPHHTGIAFLGAPPGAESAGPELQPIITATAGSAPSPGFAVNWSPHNPARRPLLEIYSLHGSSEVYDPADPLAYENAHFTFSRSVPGAHYSRDAWAAGLELGVVAASDNHAAQPGQPHGGLTAVRAPRLTRDAVFDALARKQTYGTTGQRIYMDLEIAGVKMGQRGRGQGSIKGQVTIAAPSPIARAELMRYDFSGNGYVVTHHWDNQARLLQAQFADDLNTPRVMYYLRVQLRDQVRGRLVRGWTSPVWLDQESER